MDCLANKGIAHWASLVHPKLGSCWVVNLLAKKIRAQFGLNRPRIYDQATIFWLGPMLAWPNPIRLSELPPLIDNIDSSIWWSNFPKDVTFISFENDCDLYPFVV